MKKLITDWTTNITWAAITPGSPPITRELANRMVSRTRPSRAMISSARPQAMIRETVTMSLAPDTKLVAIALARTLIGNGLNCRAISVGHRTTAAAPSHTGEQSSRLIGSAIMRAWLNFSWVNS
jgi:hypothetical protein